MKIRAAVLGLWH